MRPGDCVPACVAVCACCGAEGEAPVRALGAQPQGGAGRLFAVGTPPAWIRLTVWGPGAAVHGLLCPACCVRPADFVGRRATAGDCYRLRFEVSCYLCAASASCGFAWEDGQRARPALPALWRELRDFGCELVCGGCHERVAERLLEDHARLAAPAAALGAAPAPPETPRRSRDSLHGGA